MIEAGDAPTPTLPRRERELRRLDKLREAIVKEILLDYSKQCGDEPEKGHNRWHPDIPPAVRADEGEEVVMQTRNAFDGQITPNTQAPDLLQTDLGLVHPLTGPVYVNGAEPGDLLEVDILNIEPASWGFTTILPGFGFLRDLFLEPHIIHWQMSDGFATSEQLPGVRVPEASFMGTIGVAPSRALRQEILLREDELLRRGGAVVGPTPAGAVPAEEPFASEGLRTIPPREHGGNVDIKQLTAGTRLLLPVFTEGALFSAGRRALRTGRFGVLRHRHRDGLHPARQLPGAERRGGQPGHQLPVFRARRLLHQPRDGRTAPLPGLYGNVHRRRGERVGERDPGLPPGTAEHDSPADGEGLEPGAGILHLQRGRRPEGERGGGRAELRGVRVPAAGYIRVAKLRGLMVCGCYGHRSVGGLRQWLCENGSAFHFAVLTAVHVCDELYRYSV